MKLAMTIGTMRVTILGGVLALAFLASPSASAVDAPHPQLPLKPAVGPKLKIQHGLEPTSLTAPAQHRDGAWSRLREVHEGPVPAKPSGAKLDAVTRAPVGRKVSVDDQGMKTRTRWIGVGGFGFQRESQTWAWGGAGRTVTRVKLPFFRREVITEESPRYQNLGHKEVVTAKTNPLTGRTATESETVRTYDGLGVEHEVVTDKVKSSRSGRLLARDTTAKTTEKRPSQPESWSPEHTARASTDGNGVTTVTESIDKKDTSQITAVRIK
jgi:hypothetical protein